MTTASRRDAIRVLVAEDDSDLRYLISRWMLLAGAVPSSANSAHRVEDG